VNLRNACLTASIFALAAACTPAANEPAPPAPETAPIAEATAPSGPAAENTPDSLASSPAAATPATPAAATAPGGLKVADSPTLEQIAVGRTSYMASCAMCHGPSGQGTQMGVALTNGLEVAVIKEKITKGMVNPGDKMPPMGAALSADQLDALAKFVAAGLPA
jgi:mono/diheme cytochrome c family protein